MKRRIDCLFVLMIAALLFACAPVPTASPTPLASPSRAVPVPNDTPALQATDVPTATPQPENTPEPDAGNPDANPQVAALLAQVEQDLVEEYIYGLTGVELLTVGEPDVRIESRVDEENLQEVTDALYQFLAAQGLEVSYHAWYDENYEIGGRNVIGELRGASRPDEIVILCAHIDSTCEENLCPGADDNASGAVGVMIAAQMLPQMNFERTLRFVFFTGEEIDLLGSWYYAEELSQRGDNVVAVVNLDMLGWDGDGDGAALLYTRECGGDACAEDRAIAEAIIQAVETYGIEDLHLSITQGDDATSDSYSFWEAGFPGILAIEDDQDEENPYYHTADDSAETLDMAYLTRYVRAALAAAAELAVPLEP